MLLVISLISYIKLEFVILERYIERSLVQLFCAVIKYLHLLNIFYKLYLKNLFISTTSKHSFNLHHHNFIPFIKNISDYAATMADSIGRKNDSQIPGRRSRFGTARERCLTLVCKRENLVLRPVFDETHGVVARGKAESRRGDRTMPVVGESRSTVLRKLAIFTQRKSGTT